MKILPNTQRLGKLTFDSNQVKKSKTNPNVLIAKASDGKDYGVVRKDDGSYDYAGSSRNATFGDRMATASANPNIANRMLDTAGLLMSEPQRMMTRALSGNKYNTPSEVVANSKLSDGRLKSTLGFAADVVADPTNLVGAGIGIKSLKYLPKVNKYLPKISNISKTKSFNNLPQNVNELTNTGFKEDPFYHLELFNQKKKSVLENLKTPEGKKRLQGYINENPHLQELNKSVDNIIDDFKNTMFQADNPNNAYNWYRDGYENPSSISMGQNFTPYDAHHVLEHEFAHLFQRGKEVKGVDDVLSSITTKSDLELKEPVNIFNKLNPFNKTKDLGYSVSGDIYETGTKNIFNERGLKNARDYWSYGAGRGQEKAAFSAEVRENLLQRGLLKNRYDNIDSDMLKMHYSLYNRTLGDKYNLRLYDIMKPTNDNFTQLSKALNKMPSVTGAGYLGYNALNNNESKKYGGKLLPLLNKF
jgi:hypothetical protein